MLKSFDQCHYDLVVVLANWEQFIIVICVNFTCYEELLDVNLLKWQLSRGWGWEVIRNGINFEMSSVPWMICYGFNFHLKTNILNKITIKPWIEYLQFFTFNVEHFTPDWISLCRWQISGMLLCNIQKSDWLAVELIDGVRMPCCNPAVSNI